MPNGYDLAYAAGLLLSAPFWLSGARRRRKVFDAFAARMGRDLPSSPRAPVILIHAVSVGEVNAAPALIDALNRRNDAFSFVVTTTTQTGSDRAQQLFSRRRDVALARYPLDFSLAIRRLLDRFQPVAVVLLELEVWPNFLAMCRRRGVPVIVAAGRITEPAFKRYRFARIVTRPMFRRLAAVAAQDETYRQRFAALGVPAERLSVLGTMKFDSATIAEKVEGDFALAADLGLQPDEEPVFVCGSTGPGEEEIILRVYRRLLAEFPRLRLAIIPRHPQRFDAVAEIIRAAGFPLLRRSEIMHMNARPEAADVDPRAEAAGVISSAEAAGVNPRSRLDRPVILGDTMGELRKFYSLAAVVFVGRSLVDLGPRQRGSDMIEPAALAKPVIVGPFTGNFDMPVRLLEGASAIRIVHDADGLFGAAGELLRNGDIAGEMGMRAQSVIRSAVGSTDAHAALIARVIAHSNLNDEKTKGT